MKGYKRKHKCLSIKMKEKTNLFHVVPNEFPPHAAAGVEPASYFVGHSPVPPGAEQRVTAVPGGGGRAEEFPPFVFKLISGPKHTCYLVLMAVSLTFDSQNTNGSLGSCTFC